MKIRFQADNDLHEDILRAAKRSQPAIDFQRAPELNLHTGLEDTEALRLCTQQNRLLVTHDRHTRPLAPFTFDRREPGPRDVQIEILFCGVCHSDIHQTRNEWQGTVYPIVPGHEIVGSVTKVGSQVKSFKTGDLAGVGVLVDSCRGCASCAEGLEQYCENGFIFTYNSPDKHTGKMTYGGYSNKIVTDERFVLRVSQKLDLSAVAPLLCAGITTYSPLRHWQVGAGSKVGIVGLGGLGHMGVKFAHAFGAHVVLFTTSPGKAEDASRLGADEVVISKNTDKMKKHLNSFDFILDTVAAPHNLDAYIELLKRDGTLCLAGIPDNPHPSPSVANLVFKRLRLAGSLVGGTQEMNRKLTCLSSSGQSVSRSTEKTFVNSH